MTTAPVSDPTASQRIAAATASLRLVNEKISRGQYVPAAEVRRLIGACDDLSSELRQARSSLRKVV